MHVQEPAMCFVTACSVGALLLICSLLRRLLIEIHTELPYFPADLRKPKASQTSNPSSESPKPSPKPPPHCVLVGSERRSDVDPCRWDKEDSLDLVLVPGLLESDMRCPMPGKKARQFTTHTMHAPGLSELLSFNLLVSRVWTASLNLCESLQEFQRLRETS